MEVSRADDSAQNVCLVHRRPGLNLQNHNKRNSVQNMADLYRKYVMMSVSCTKIRSWELLTKLGRNRRQVTILSNHSQAASQAISSWVLLTKASPKLHVRNCKLTSNSGIIWFQDTYWVSQCHKKSQCWLITSITTWCYSVLCFVFHGIGHLETDTRGCVV